MGTSSINCIVIKVTSVSTLSCFTDEINSKENILSYTSKISMSQVMNQYILQCKTETLQHTKNEKLT